MATSAGTTYQCTVTGPNNGLYTAAVISNVSVPANNAYFTIANNLVSGTTYQISLTASGLGGAKLYITDGLNTFLPNTAVSASIQLTSTLTAYTGAPTKASGSNLYMVIQAPVSSGMSVQFKDLSISRLDTTLSGNVGMNNNSSLYLYNFGASNNAGLRANPGGDTVFFNGTGGVVDRMVLQSGTGYLGIGTPSPICPLHVESYSYMRTSTYTTINNANGYYFGYWTGLNKVETWNRDWDFNCSIWARSSIWTLNHIISASDERIKKNIEPVQGALDKIRRLDVVSYDRIDYRERGVNAGVLARNVRDILPKAVHASNQTIPNIYLPATHLKIQSGVRIEVKCDDKDIKEGSKVKLMIMQGDKEVEHISNMTNWTGSSFEVEEWKEYSEEDKVFAYGVEVDDFLNVDKEQIGILAAGAVKELVQVVEDLTAKSDAQSREISELKRLVGSLLQ